MKKRLIKEFTDIFEVPGEALFFSPGRVNLIGEHTDYNGGMVFPCTGRTYYTHFPFLYTPPHRTARKGVPPRLSEGAAHKKAAAPGEERGTAAFRPVPAAGSEEGYTSEPAAS